MTIDELKNECQKLIDNMHYAVDVYYIMFEKKYSDSKKTLNVIFDKFKEELNND